MPDKYVIRYLPIAVEDLISIFDWIAADSPGNAAKFIDMLDKRIGALATHPLLGRLPRADGLKELGYRVLIIEAYLVFYVVRGKVVELHRVVRGSRDLEGIV